MTTRKWTTFFRIPRDIYGTLPTNNFQARCEKLLENHSAKRVWENVCCVQSREEKRTKRNEPDDRVTRNNKERRMRNARIYEWESRERESRERKVGDVGETAAGYGIVRPFKSQFFWPHRHSQNPPIYRSMSNKATSTNLLMLRVTIRTRSGAIYSSFLLIANYSYLSVFTSNIGLLP